MEIGKWLVLPLAVFGQITLTESTDSKDLGLDLTHFVTRPELQAPLLDITIHDAKSLTPGYWFLAPYASLSATTRGKEYVPFQAGPMVFDDSGELIWSGADIVENSNTFNFRLSNVNDSATLTFLLTQPRKSTEDKPGYGIILDSSYQIRNKVHLTPKDESLNIHEFNIVSGGRSCLYVTLRKVVRDLAEIGNPGTQGTIEEDGFREIDLLNSKILFEWFPRDHISLAETKIKPPDKWPGKGVYDCLHTNSVDKFADGDYLVSMRYTNTLYKVSGKDGSVVWRLVGTEYDSVVPSDFSQDFNFSSQHDATIVSQNETVTVLFFLDNASDEKDRQPATSTVSSMKLIALYEKESPKRAKLIRQFARPDGNLTKLRGSAQLLSNGGAVAGWSHQGYVTEFAPDGRTILEGKFVSDRFDNYRSYKFDFVGLPAKPPVLKTFAFGNDDQLLNMSSVFYVSWNGATEVATWSFHGCNDLARPYQNLGSIVRRKFETSFISHNFWAFSYVEAFDKNGTSLGKSAVQEIILPNGYQANITAVGLQLTREIEDYTATGSPLAFELSRSVSIISAAVFLGLLWSCAFPIIYLVWKKKKAPTSYRALPDEDEAEDRGLMELRRPKEEDKSFTVHSRASHSGSASGGGGRHRSQPSIGKETDLGLT